MSFSIRQKQHDAVVQMLNLNTGRLGASSLDENAPNEVYKVLVMDRHCFEIITPLVKVHELRRHGVTLHLLLENDRQPIPDVPAVYFVAPTEDNVTRITNDLAKGLYDASYLNFSSSLPRKLLEQLAVKSTECGASSKVVKVYDQYLDFVSLSSDLFSLGMPKSYVTLNDPTASDTSVETEINEIALGLVAACATLGKAPIIRCPKGGAAEMIGRALEKQLRDHLKGKGSLFQMDVSSVNQLNERPLLCIFDRNFDVPTVLQHSWSYQPLVHDVLHMRLNRVDILGENPADRLAGKKSYDLELEDDSFWNQNAGSQFPVVAEEVEKALGGYKKAMAEITDTTGGGDDGSTAASHASKLVSAVASLPQLQERKKIIDKHTNIATALLQHIKTRGLDEYHVVEADLLQGKGDRAAIMGLLDATGRGTPEDKLRLAIVRAAAAARQRARDGGDGEDPATSASDMEAVEGALRASGADTAAFEFFQKATRVDVSLSMRGARAMGNDPDNDGGGDLLDWADRLYGQSIDAVAKGVQSLLRGDKRGAVARATEALVSNQPGTVEVDTFAYFDPKASLAERERMPYTGSQSNGGAPTPSFSKAVVFVAGGGNYGEYQDVLSLANDASSERTMSRTNTGSLSVVYGATELVTGAEFVGQLAELGRKSRR
ncbi:Sec1 family protein [bacterium]|nr:Sec1 family protein [bacterium]|tara:strand:- start:5909 stop:7891 length:1983 start_codon:yes stop_codon:yes gene_type:complete